MLRLIFMGTPDFAVPTLAALIEAGHEVAAVYSQPPRAAGRGMALRKSPVQRLAEDAGLAVFAPGTLQDKTEQDRFREIDADLAVVVAYGQLLPKSILDAPRHGCFNLHASLLPRWRGAAPIQRAIMAGDAETGLCVMRMEQGLDTGPVCRVERVAIEPEETAGELHGRLELVGADLMVRVLEALEQGQLDCQAQASEGVTYAKKIGTAEARIDWSLPAPHVHNLIRGLSPFPGAWFEMGDTPERVKALRSALTDGSGPPGTLLDERLTIACGSGAIRLVEVQRAGKRPLSAEDFLRGAKLGAGARLY